MEPWEWSEESCGGEMKGVSVGILIKEFFIYCVSCLRVGMREGRKDDGGLAIKEE